MQQGAHLLPSAFLTCPRLPEASLMLVVIPYFVFLIMWLRRFFRLLFGAAEHVGVGF